MNRNIFLAMISMLSFAAGVGLCLMLSRAGQISFDTSLKLSDFIGFFGAMFGIAFTIVATGIVEDRKQDRRNAQGRLALEETIRLLLGNVEQIRRHAWPLDGSGPKTSFTNRLDVAVFVEVAGTYETLLANAGIRHTRASASLRRTGFFLKWAKQFFQELLQSASTEANLYEEAAKSSDAHSVMNDLRAGLKCALEDKESWTR